MTSRFTARNKTPPPTGPVTVHFSVHCRFIRPFEFVFISGSNARLGSWLPDQAVELVPDPKNESICRTSIELPSSETRELLNFRYFVGYYLQSSDENSTKMRIISRWESQRCARSLLPSVECVKGVCRLNHVDEFGIYGGRELITDGWLNHPHQNEILLRLHGEALKFYKQRHSQKHYYIKVTPFDLRHKEQGGADEDPDEGDSLATLPLLPSFSHTDLAVLSRDDPSFHDQNACGELFRNDQEYLVFRTQSVAVEFLAFRIELFAEGKAILSHSAERSTNSAESCNTSPNLSAETNSTDSNGNDSVSLIPPLCDPKLERVAIAYCMPASMHDTFGQTLVPILAKSQQPIGQLSIDYLFIRSLSRPLKHVLTMENSYSRHWKKRRTVEVGHRGMGSSYTKFSSVRENTIHSLTHASKKGADFVEFDVQLTKDKVAVIFHDFHVLVSVAKRFNSNLDLSQIGPQEAESVGQTGPQRPKNEHVRNGNLSSDYHELAVKDLTLQQLQALHVDHYRAHENTDKLKVTGDANEAMDNRPFPTLVDALRLVDMDTGFNVEVKYPMLMTDGEHECANYFERNQFIDVVLRDVIENAGTRRILFSSFEPDICAMIARKQSLFPVLFLCVGNTTRYVPFLDKRSSTSLTAVNFAASCKLLGLNFHSEELLRDRLPVERAKHFGLVSFVWGDDLDTHNNIDYFRKELAVDGIVYDKIGEIEARKNVFLVEREVRNVLFRSAISPTPSRIGSIDQNTNALTLAGPNPPRDQNGHSDRTNALLLADHQSKTSPKRSVPNSKNSSGSSSGASSIERKDSPRPPKPQKI